MRIFSPESTAADVIPCSVASCRDSDPGNPPTADARLDRLESLAEIRQLPVRYALALDSRDMDMMVSLFTPDVRVGREATRTRRAARLVRDDAERAEDVGALRRQPHRRLRRRRPRARHRLLPRRARPPERRLGPRHAPVLGHVRARRRRRQEWCFDRRKFLRWYMVDALERPAHGAGVGAGPRRPHHPAAPRGVRVVGPLLGRRSAPTRSPRRRASSRCRNPTAPVGAAPPASDAA